MTLEPCLHQFFITLEMPLMEQKQLIICVTSTSSVQMGRFLHCFDICNMQNDLRNISNLKTTKFRQYSLDCVTSFSQYRHF